MCDRASTPVLKGVRLLITRESSLARTHSQVDHHLYPRSSVVVVHRDDFYCRALRQETEQVMSTTMIEKSTTADVDGATAASVVVAAASIAPAAMLEASDEATDGDGTPSVRGVEGHAGAEEGHNGDGGSGDGSGGAESSKESTTPPLEVIGGYPVHPAASIFPLMMGKEFEDLVTSIADRGQRDPVVLHEGKVVDGRNRVRAVEELRARGMDITLLTTQWQPRPGESIAQYIADKNLHRRQLDAAQRAQVAADLIVILEQEQAAAQATTRIRPGEIRNPGGRNQHTAEWKADANPASPSKTKADSRERARRSTAGRVAEVAKVSHYEAARAVKIKKHASPEDIAAVKSGTKRARDVAKTIKATGGNATAAAKKPGKPKPKKIDHPFVPKDDFEYDALRAWVKWIDTTLSVTEKPRARTVFRAIFKAEEAAEPGKGGAK